MRLRHLSLTALALVAVGVPLGSRFAIAQTTATTSTYSTTCDRKPSPSDEETAQAYFKIGKKAYDEADYQKAIDNLKEAYKLDCTKPILLNYVASAYIAKGDKAEAIAALEAFTKRDPKAADAEGVPRKIANLKQALAAQTSTATASTTGATSTGTTSASATTTSTAPTASATDTATPPPERGHTALPWVIVGVGGAAIVGGIVMVGVGASKVSDSLSQCPMTICPKGVDPKPVMALNNDGHTLENVSIVLFAVGGAAVAGGLLWHFLEPTGPAKTTTGARPEIGPGWVGLSGTF